MKKFNFYCILLFTAITLFSMSSCSKDEDEETIVDLKVVINTDGSTSNGSVFSAIDDKSFYLDYIRYTIKDDHLIVSGYAKEDFKGNAKIASSITYKQKSYDVLGISDYAFSSCKKLTSITLPNHITSIGSYAFEDCWALTKVTMPNDLTNLGEHAFSGCTELSGISIPSGVKTIQSRTFWMCYGLKSVTLKGVTEIGFDGFAFCKSLTSISLPKTLTTIGMGAFFSCGSLENIALPDAVTSIGDDAFENCKSLKSIVFPMNLESLASNAFVGCNSLTTVTMHKNVKNIGSDAFDNCSQLATVFYLGTQDEWLSIDIGTPNNELLGANIIFVGDPYDMKFAQVTGIDQIMNNGQNNATIFTLDGKRVNKPQKGINIIGGKKVVVK